MTDETTVVTGLGRCGTSLMMQMLAAGGMKCLGTAPDYEDERQLRLPDDTGWLDEARGGAVKILDPARHRLPNDRPYAFILLTRDPIQQAESQIKLASLCAGVRADLNARRVLAGSIRRGNDALPELLESYSSARLLQLTFERIIIQPFASAMWVAEFISRGSPDAMAAVVRRRPTTCLPRMAEFDSNFAVSRFLA